jgi:dTDP-glucose 4,6-dehydratase
VNLLVTGGAGFIGSCFARHVRRTRSDDLLVNVDALTYAGNLENLRHLLGDPRHVFVREDIRNGAAMLELMRRHDIEAVVNFAAESHVDRSIRSAAPFFDTNVLGTLRLLEAAREAGVRRFLQISTDEVYGAVEAPGTSDEASPLAPRNPYAASKAAADHLVTAFHETHGMDTVITRGSNNYGPYQFPEKLVPLAILNALDGEPLPIYGDGLQVRDWIHVEDHCEALDLVLARGVSGEVYNVGADNQRTNLEVVREILALTGRGPDLVRHVADRPGHDRRYAISSRKIHDALGWRPRHGFEAGLAQTVTWYRENWPWAERVRSGAYRDYYRLQYGPLLGDGAGPR